MVRHAAVVRAARDALPAGARPLLALGRQHLAQFASRPDLSPVPRMFDAPADPTLYGIAAALHFFAAQREGHAVVALAFDEHAHAFRERSGDSA